MKRRNTILCSVVFTLLFISVQSQLIAKVKIRRIRQEGQVILIVQDCKLKLKQSATGFEFGGLDFTSGPLKKAGSIKVDQKLLQSMNAEAQILDQFQFDSCQQINTIPLSAPNRTSLAALNGLSNYHLAQLALFAQMYSDNADKLHDVLLKWIVSSSELAQQVWAKH